MFLVKIGILQVFQLLKYVKIGFCRGEGEAASYLTLPQLVEGLKLEERTRSISYLLLLLTVQSITCFCSPWGVFEVDVENMRGVERGLDWVLHHLAKKRYSSLNFTPSCFCLSGETGAITRAREKREQVISFCDEIFSVNHLPCLGGK